MALVMLPCDLPWWEDVTDLLCQIASVTTSTELVALMQNIYNICSICLDPDEDDAEQESHFFGILDFLENDASSDERHLFFEKNLPFMVSQALALKERKPRSGLHFSLRQQPDSVQLSYEFVASLIANAFFCTFPRRTEKTHPTLQDFNFSHFFGHLNVAIQKCKLRAVLHYFDWLRGGSSANFQGSIKVSRHVMSSKEWLTIEDWLECNLPLCPLHIKHEGRVERVASDAVQICFANSKVGSEVLSVANTQESITIVSHPELLVLLLNVEALEDNEVLTVECCRQLGRIVDPKSQAIYVKLDNALEVTVCCMDAENYSRLPLSQYEEDNVLRELNKCFLAFQQKQSIRKNLNRMKRLSPIGESNHSSESWRPKTEKQRMDEQRRGRFIVLGSSGERLPVSRAPTFGASSSSEDEFYSARTSLDYEDSDVEEDGYHKRYSMDLETADRRNSFAQRLRDALRHEDTASSLSMNESSSISSDSGSYAVGISVSGGHVTDRQIKVKRGGSMGFTLQDDLDSKGRGPKYLSKRSRTTSSDYSFSTEYSSELGEVYEQFSRWLADPVLECRSRNESRLQGRQLAVVQFAGSLLKRTLSESFAGVQLPLADQDSIIPPRTCHAHKLVLNAKSLSLELARHKHRLAAQLLSQISDVPTAAELNDTGPKPVSTGNWGCGSTKGGHPQLKMVIQWLAASVAGLPYLIYHTCAHPELSKMDTVSRILVDRQWTVQDLVHVTLNYATRTLVEGGTVSISLFEQLIGIERPRDFWSSPM